MTEFAALNKEIKKQANRRQAKFLQRFFKTGRGGYAEGDLFLGIRVPAQRQIARKFSDLNFADLQKLLKSPIHEHRFIALEILDIKFEHSNAGEQQKISKFYLKNTKYVNNWDLVDTSAPYILGKYLLDKPRAILYKLAKSANIWERRIAIVSTMELIRKNQFEDTIKISKILLNDRHDLIHKAVGWMLREVGKRDEKTLVNFLDKYLHQMPRTSLRYAIERFPERQRKAYLAR